MHWEIWRGVKYPLTLRFSPFGYAYFVRKWRQ